MYIVRYNGVEMVEDRDDKNSAGLGASCLRPQPQGNRSQSHHARPFSGQRRNHEGIEALRKKINNLSVGSVDERSPALRHLPDLNEFLAPRVLEPGATKSARSTDKSRGDHQGQSPQWIPDRDRSLAEGPIAWLISS
jgi:hypothetical protein